MTLPSNSVPAGKPASIKTKVYWDSNSVFIQICNQWTFSPHHTLFPVGERVAVGLEISDLQKGWPVLTNVISNSPDIWNSLVGAHPGVQSSDPWPNFKMKWSRRWEVPPPQELQLRQGITMVLPKPWPSPDAGSPSSPACLPRFPEGSHWWLWWETRWNQQVWGGSCLDGAVSLHGNVCICFLWKSSCNLEW